MQIRYQYNKIHCREDYWTSTPLDEHDWQFSYYKLVGYMVNHINRD